MLKFVSYDRNVVQFYGTCPLGDQTMLVLEYMEVPFAINYSYTSHPLDIPEQLCIVNG